jgi:ribose/xylose/arabinose/galactoside ABC-type transport system permease subunit
MNLQNILVQATVLGLLALAVALPLLVGEIDLSLPANLGFSSAIGAWL